MLTLHYFHSNLNKILSRFLIVTSMAAISIVFGIIPYSKGESFSLSFNSAVYAQSFSDEEIRRYAQAGVQIENKRARALIEIQRIVGSTPNISCDRPKSYRNLHNQARKIAQQFCRESQSIVRNSGLSNQRFNQIYQRVRQGDRDLNQRIQREINRYR